MKGINRPTTLIEIQTQAIESILNLPEQGTRAASHGRSLLNKSPRRLRAIRKTYERHAARQGWIPRQIDAQWGDIKDMAKLEAIAE